MAYPHLAACAHKPALNQVQVTQILMKPPMHIVHLLRLDVREYVLGPTRHWGGYHQTLARTNYRLIHAGVLKHQFVN